METKPTRLVALDALRGLTIAGMILVNYAGSFPGMYWPLCHSAWNGFTPTDLVFPTFLFIVGAAMWFSFKPLGHRLTGAAAVRILRRSALIFGVGLALNALGCLQGDPLRIFGVLQRIGLCFGLASLLCLTLNPRQLLGAAAALLLGYWGLLLAFGGADPLSLHGNAVLRLDLAVVGPRHLYQAYGIPFDPEGLLSTLPAIVNVLAGFLAGRLVDRIPDREQAVLQLFLWGVPLLFLGWVWSFWMPINKPIWSSSYVLWTVGLALVLLAFTVWALDVKGLRRLAKPFVVFGENPLFIYVLAFVGEDLLGFIQVAGPTGKVSLMEWLDLRVCAPLIGPVAGGVAVTLAVILGLLGVAWVLHRKKIFIRL